MKPPFKLTLIAILAASVTLVLSGCGKKDATSETDEAATTTSSTHQSKPDAVTATAAVDHDTKEAENAASKAEAEAESASIKGQQEAAFAAAKTHLEAAESAVQAETEAIEAQAKTEAAEAETKAQMESIQEQATEMLANYSEEIDVLATNVAKLTAMVEKNPGLFPDGVAEKCAKLKSLVPELSTMVHSLTDYRGTDLSNLASKIETDYSKCRDLYKDAVALIPEGFTLDSIKIP